MSDIRKAIMERLGEFARFGEKAEMANHIRTVAEDKEASRRGLRRMIDQLESEWQSLNNQPSKAGRIPRMETIKKQIAGLEERLKSLSSRPGAKATMAAGEPDMRSFRLPGEIADVRKKINDYTKALENDLRSGKYSTAAARCKAIGAMYGPGGGSLSWFYEEYADALKNRGYARSGNKSRFAQPPFSASDLNALKRLVQQYEQKAKTSKGVRTETGMNAEWEAISIANHLREIVGYAQAGQTHRAYAQVRMSSPDVVRILPASLVRAAQEVTKMSRPGEKAKMGKAASIESDANKAFQLLQQIHKDASVNHPVAKVFSLLSGIIAAAQMMERQGYSRPGAKAKMEKWTVVMPSIPDAGTRHFDSWEQAKKYVDSKMGGFTALVSVDGKRYALKHALGQWEKFSRHGAKATAAKPAETPAMRELGRKMQELTQKADRLLRQSLSASVTSEQSQQMQDEVERISEQLDAMGEDLARQRKAAGFEKPSDLEREDVKAGLKLMEKADQAVSDKIRTLIKEGKPQDQAVAIALDMKRRGEL